MKRVICFGGSFNPPHFAHLEVAKHAMKEIQAQELWFIPSMDNPFKPEETHFEARCQMVEALVKPYKRMLVCRIEAELPTPSYTYQTVLELKKRYKDVQFYWLIGSDQALVFDSWHESKNLIKEIPFIVYPRGEVASLPKEFRVLQTNEIYPISSTQIRHGDLRFIPQTVLTIMLKHELYLDTISASMVSQKRFEHVQAVTELALELGSAHQLDLHVIYLAALFHDCAKEWTFNESEAWLKALNPEYLNQKPALWHQVLGAFWVKRNLHIHDQRILKAISHHVQGDSHDAYTQVIFIADKCDRTRGYDASKLISLAMKNLKQGYEAVSQNQKAYLIQEGVIRE